MRYFDFTIFFSGLSGFPVLVMTLSGISMLIVYALLKFFENDIPDPRFEVNPRPKSAKVPSFIIYTDASFNFTKKNNASKIIKKKISARSAKQQTFAS